MKEEEEEETTWREGRRRNEAMFLPYEVQQLVDLSSFHSSGQINLSLFVLCFFPHSLTNSELIHPKMLIILDLFTRACIPKCDDRCIWIKQQVRRFARSSSRWKPRTLFSLSRTINEKRSWGTLTSNKVRKHWSRDGTCNRRIHISGAHTLGCVGTPEVYPYLRCTYTRSAGTPQVYIHLEYTHIHVYTCGADRCESVYSDTVSMYDIYV